MIEPIYEICQACGESVRVRCITKPFGVMCYCSQCNRYMETVWFDDDEYTDDESEQDLQ